MHRPSLPAKSLRTTLGLGRCAWGPEMLTVVIQPCPVGFPSQNILNRNVCTVQYGPLHSPDTFQDGALVLASTWTIVLVPSCIRSQTL